MKSVRPHCPKPTYNVKIGASLPVFTVTIIQSTKDEKKQLSMRQTISINAEKNNSTLILYKIRVELFFSAFMLIVCRMLSCFFSSLVDWIMVTVKTGREAPIFTLYVGFGQ